MPCGAILTITGQVETGSLDLAFRNQSGDEVWKNLDNDQLVYCHWVEPYPTYVRVYTVGAVPANGLLVGWTTSTVSLDGSTMTISYNNIFPIPGSGWDGDGGWIIDGTICNLGTVPMKLHADIDLDNALLEPLVTTEIDGLPNDPPFEGTQLHEGCYSFFVKIIIPDDNAYQNQSGTLTIRIQGVQWNEWQPGPIQ